MSHQKTLVLSTFLAISLTACKHLDASDSSSSNTLTWQTIYKSHQCSIRKPQVRLMHIDEGEPFYLKEMEQLRRRVIGQQLQIKEIEEEQSVLLIAMGQKSSGGYSVNVDAIHLIDNDLTVKANWVTPPPGSMTTSALTSPCAIVTLDQEFTKEELKSLTVHVVDRTGKAVLSNMKAAH